MSELLFAQISENNSYQEPNTISMKRRTASINQPKENPYKQYSADGQLESNNFWNQSPLIWPSVPEPNDSRNGGPIYALNKYGGIVNGYQPSIIRPIDSVMVPRDLNRGTFDEEKCNWPCYAGSKYQKWCSEEDAINYHAMRPLVNPNTYNMWLEKLFYTVVEGHNKELPIQNDVWSSVFCDNSKSSIMNFMMEKVAKGVSLIPEMHKNGSWGVEQFYWTDAKLFQYVEPGLGTYYRILFNLYNPLRSVGTEVQAVVFMNPEKPADLSLKYMGFVNQLEWKMDGQSIDGVSGFNVAPAGRNPQIDIETEIETPQPTDVGWLYGNTLLDQQFNQYGFYEEGSNVQIESGVPESLKKRIKTFEQQSPSYLLGCSTPKYSGVVNDFNTEKDARNVKRSGTAMSMNQSPDVVFGVPLSLKESVPLKNGIMDSVTGQKGFQNTGFGETFNFQRYPETVPIGRIHH
jgi:hypothetical protein